MATASLSPSVLLLSKLVSLVSMSAPINRPAVWSGVDVRTLLLWVPFYVSPAFSLPNTPKSSNMEPVLLK